jgi:hypothetical protein
VVSFVFCVFKVSLEQFHHAPEVTDAKIVPSASLVPSHIVLSQIVTPLLRSTFYPFFFELLTRDWRETVKRIAGRMIL